MSEYASHYKQGWMQTAEKKDIEELFKAIEAIVENDKFRNLLKNHLSELKERCE